MSGGGNDTPPTQQVTSSTTTSNLPEYARPYYENVLNRAQAESYREYTPYQGQRIAGFTPDQQNLQTEIRNMQTPGQFGAASDLAYGAGMNAMQAGGYNPAQAYSQQVNQPQLNQYQLSGPSNVNHTNVNSPMMGTAQTAFAPNLQQQRMEGVGNVSAPGAGGYNSFLMEGGNDANYNPADLQDFSMATPEQFGNPQAQQYMSPYIQNVLDVQKREAITDAKKTQLAADLGSVRQGTHGGARQLLAATERERALGQQLGDIEARGLQSAYENAQGQFERDRTAGMSADQQNLQSRLGVQQLGAGADRARVQLALLGA